MYSVIFLTAPKPSFSFSLGKLANMQKSTESSYPDAHTQGPDAIIIVSLPYLHQSFLFPRVFQMTDLLTFVPESLRLCLSTNREVFKLRSQFSPKYPLWLIYPCQDSIKDRALHAVVVCPVSLLKSSIPLTPTPPFFSPMTLVFLKNPGQ